MIEWRQQGLLKTKAEVNMGEVTAILPPFLACLVRFERFNSDFHQLPSRQAM